MECRGAECVKGLFVGGKGLGDGEVGVFLELTGCEGEEGREEEDGEEERCHWEGEREATWKSCDDKDSLMGARRSDHGFLVV